MLILNFSEFLVGEYALNELTRFFKTDVQVVRVAVHINHYFSMATQVKRLVKDALIKVSPDNGLVLVPSDIGFIILPEVLPVAILISRELPCAAIITRLVRTNSPVDFFPGEIIPSIYGNL